MMRGVLLQAAGTGHNLNIGSVRVGVMQENLAERSPVLQVMRLMGMRVMYVARKVVHEWNAFMMRAPETTMHTRQSITVIHVMIPAQSKSLDSTPPYSSRPWPRREISGN